MSEKYIVRYAIFRRRGGGAVYHAAGSDKGSRRHGYPSVPPPPYRAPREETRTVSSYAQARQLAKELKLEHGERIAVTVERLETEKAAKRPTQLDLGDVGNDWPHLRPARWRLTR